VILGVANAIAADAPEGFSSVLREVVPITGASQPLLVHCADERDQSESVANRVLEFYEQGTPLQKQAVLFRAAHHSGDLEIELARRRIPFVKYGGLRYLEAAHVKDLLAAFRLADNPRDEVAWFRLLQLMPGVGPAKARRGYQRPPRRGRESPLSHGEVGRRWSIVDEELPSEVREMWRDLADAMCEKELEPWRCMRSGFVELSCRSLHLRMRTPWYGSKDLGALVLACAGRYD